MDFSGLINDFGPLTVTGLAQGAIIALFALGYTLVYGVLRLINFAHSEVFLLGTYATILTWGLFGLDQNSAAPSVGPMLLYMVVGLVAAIIVSGAAALTVEFVAYRPLRRRNAPPLAFLITAIGASLFISEVVGVATHRNQTGVPPIIQARPLFTIGDTTVTNLQVLIILLALVMMFALDRFINGSRLGRGVRAVAQNPDSAALMGVNKSRVIALVFLLGGLMAGIAAVMYDLKIGVTRYDAGFLLGIDAFTAAVLGGIGNLRGALLGGLLLGVLQNYAAGLFGSQWLHAASFVLLVVILLFRPTGLLGESLGRSRA
ncbi:branched-chain amino acid ABC transporter permease [Paractinoplanes hotanensis]|uniref:Branched-chain amino acid ABC transporter permease n=1 Tax=Paractinoplanes hotanensis TaxID=2906497 RepID=A0ABT0Y6Y2_9ACTN|nr:branched-chain amino acid ABC transporter permease [Actinoplanes hotanensis]MCM4081303.1 branched-chain amino acid ABC transporter permease [Actinoplanes hotanensis]